MQTKLDELSADLAKLRDVAFPDLYFTGERPLEISLTSAQNARYVRLELRETECLHLSQVSVYVQSKRGIVLARPAAVRMSSSSGAQSGEKLAATLTKGKMPYAAHTLKERQPWIEIDLGRRRAIHCIVIRNRTSREERAWSLVVRVYTWPLLAKIVYSHADRMEEFARAVEGYTSFRRVNPSFVREVSIFCRCAGMMARLRFKEAEEFLKLAGLGKQQQETIRRAMNRQFVGLFQRFWNPHGIRRTFKFWTKGEQKRYLSFTNKVLHDLSTLSPHVCLGFGAVLSAVRDKALLPHDDDLDIIISFPREDCPTLTEAIRRIEVHLRKNGYSIRGEFVSHRQIYVEGIRSIDVFVGLEESGTVSWYPQPRGSLSVDDVFPAAELDLIGIPCRFPRLPEVYLEAVYGPDWRVPNSRFKHKWKKDAYDDIL